MPWALTGSVCSQASAASEKTKKASIVSGWEEAGWICYRPELGR